MNEKQIIQIPIENLKRGKYQPRVKFDKQALEELARSIKSLGLIQPITVRQISSQIYEIVAGERRWRAAQLAGLKEVSCIIYDFSEEDAARAATIENLQRQDLNPIEEAKAYHRLMNDFNYTHEKIAEALGKSRTKITNSLRLLSLNERVQGFLIEGSLSEGHGKVLLSSPLQYQEKLAEKCITQAWSVRKLEHEIRSIQEMKIIEKHDPNILNLENKITAQLAAEVKLEQENSGSGWIKIRYYNLDTLEHIFEKIGINIKED